MKTLTNSKNGQTINSPYSDEKAFGLMAIWAYDSENRFGMDLAQIHEQYMLKRSNRQLTNDQWYWVHKLAMDMVKEESETTTFPTTTPPVGMVESAPAMEGIRKVVPVLRTGNVDIGDSKAVYNLFNTAMTNLKYPKLRFAIADDATLVVAIAGERSKYTGQLMLTDGGSYGNNTYYGRIEGSTFYPSSQATPEMIDIVKELCADPISFANACGLKTGKCCFCGDALKHAGYGYGPVCAKNWGLPYSRKGANSAFRCTSQTATA